MHRILVIKDVSLWIALNRHYSGTGAVRLSEAPTLELGLELAEIERPDVVVVSVESARRSASELARAFRERHLEEVRVVCVDDTGGAGSSPEADAEGRVGSLQMTTSESFLDEVGRSIELPRVENLGAVVELLAHFEAPSAGGEPRRGFANVLELSAEQLLIEADDELEVGDCLTLSFFLPEVAGTSARRSQISGECEVTSCLESSKLLYAAVFRELDDEGALLIKQFVRARAESGSGGSVTA